jgi:hypothetical protein
MPVTTAWEKYLERIYKNPKHPGSFSGPLKLYQAVKNEGKFIISLGKISRWLKGNSTYTFNRIAHRKFKRNSVVVAGVDALWDADLIDLSLYKKQNDNSSYILLMIDIFSRYVYLRPLKTKSGVDVIEGMQSIFEIGRQPKTLRTDKGREFTNVRVSTFYETENIHHYVTFNDTQANYAERCIKTIKTKIFRYMKQHNVHRYIDIIEGTAAGYNNSIHRSLGRTPSSVNTVNEDEVRLDQYLLKNKQTLISKKPKASKVKNIKPGGEKSKKRIKSPFSLKEGDIVRISLIKGKFDREYDQKWSMETFTVTRRFLREKIPIYIIEDMSNEGVEGTFYSKELQKVTVKDDEEYIVEKVIRREGVNSLVKWQGWPKKFNSWIPSKNVRLLL